MSDLEKCAKLAEQFGYSGSEYSGRIVERIPRKKGRKPSGREANAHKRQDPRGKTLKKAPRIGWQLIGRSKLHEISKRRPFLVWSVFVNADQEVLGVEAMGMSTKENQRFFGADLKDGRSYTKPGSTSFLTNHAVNSVHNVNNDLILPDIILRRAHCLIAMKCSTQIPPAHVRLIGGQFRQGIVFNAISQSDVAYPGPDFVAFDTHDAPINQIPYTIPEFLEQEDIDRIARIAINYRRYCVNKCLPIIWPEPRQYGNWPEQFENFEDDTYIPQRLEWLGDSRITPETGIPCPPGRSGHSPGEPAP